MKLRGGKGGSHNGRLFIPYPQNFLAQDQGPLPSALDDHPLRAPRPTEDQSTTHRCVDCVHGARDRCPGIRKSSEDPARRALCGNASLGKVEVSASRALRRVTGRRGGGVCPHWPGTQPLQEPIGRVRPPRGRAVEAGRGPRPASWQVPRGGIPGIGARSRAALRCGWVPPAHARPTLSRGQRLVRDNLLSLSRLCAAAVGRGAERAQAGVGGAGDFCSRPADSAAGPPGGVCAPASGAAGLTIGLRVGGGSRSVPGGPGRAAAGLARTGQKPCQNLPVFSRRLTGFQRTKGPKVGIEVPRVRSVSWHSAPPANEPATPRG